ncbi:MAG TPA: hypothetical protein VD713_05645 [Sphingomonadales bacterium]|nr:hypothetical protein [Sphingomonadales bacterium]
MGPYEMVVAVVAIAVVAGVIRHGQKMRALRKAGGISPETEANARRIEKLEERVKVLEKIATDRRSRLSDDIDNL